MKLTDAQMELAHDLLNEFGGGETISVMTANAMAASGKISRWQDALSMDTRDWTGTRLIGKHGRDAIDRAKRWHAERGNVALIPDVATQDSPRVDNPYAEAIGKALALHCAASSIVGQTMLLLDGLKLRGLRMPNDFSIPYMAQTTFRWWDGSDYHGHTRYCDVTVFEAWYSVGMNIPDGKSRYSDHGKSDVVNLSLPDALDILRIMVRKVDGK